MHIFVNGMQLTGEDWDKVNETKKAGLGSDGRELCCYHQCYFEGDGAGNGFGRGRHKLAWFARIGLMIRGWTVGHVGRISWLRTVVRKGSIHEK